MLIDKDNEILHDVVLMTTLINKNENYQFTLANLVQVKRIGEKKKVYCYLGHARNGITSDDRLPFRIGFFENYKIIDENTLKADLVLSPTADENPILKARLGVSMSDYLFALAENEANDCGMSVSIKIFDPNFESANVEGEVIIVDVSSIDLVEDPALTFALFSTDKKDSLNITNMNAPDTTQDINMEEVDPRLAKAYDLFNQIDTALKAGQDVTDLVTSLTDELAKATTPQEAQEAAQPEEDTTDLPAPIEDAKEAEEQAPVEDTAAEPDNATLSALLDGMGRIEAAIDRFIATLSGGDDPESFSTKKDKEKIITFSAPIDDEPKPINHKQIWQSLRDEGRLAEATSYYRKNIA